MSAHEALTGAIESALTDPLSAIGLDLEAVEVSAAGKRSVVRVAVDKDGGVTMDDVTEATRVVGEVLDTDLSARMGQQAYTLEVTSRGVDRPLVLPRHWRRNHDRLVRLTTDDGTVTGRIGTADDDEGGGVDLDVDGTVRRVAYADVRKALVQVEFNRKQAEPVEPDQPDEPDHGPDKSTDDSTDDSTDRGDDD